MAAIAAAAITAGAGILGDLFSQSGQQSTNAANLQIAQMQDTFNANQAQLNRDFIAGQQTQAEQYNTQMSDTSMQRRVADLKAAGLNPMLAIGAGGASAPVMSAPGGSQASAAQAASMQNPNAAFGNMGSTASAAVAAYQNSKSVQSQVDLNTSQAGTNAAQAANYYAQAAKTAGVDTELGSALAAKATQDTKTSATQADLNDAHAVLAGAQTAAAQARASLDVNESRQIDAYLQYKMPAEIAQLMSSKGLNDSAAAVNRVDADLKQFSLGQNKAIYPFVVEQAVNAAKAGGYQNDVARNLANFANTEAGKASPFVQTYVPLIIQALQTSVPWRKF